MRINSYYPTNNGYIVETDDDTIKLDSVTSPMISFIQESYSESQLDNLVHNIQEHQFEFCHTPSIAKAFNNVSTTSLILEDAIIEYEPKLTQKVLEQVNNLFKHHAIASGLYMMNKVSAPVSFNGKISEQEEIQFKTDCATLSSRNMMYTTKKIPLTNRVIEDEFIYENKGKIYRIPLQYIKEDADQVDVAIREDFGIHIQPTFESLYGHKLTRKSDNILEVETLNQGRYIIETENTLPEQNELFLMNFVESVQNPHITKICLTEAESFPTPGGYPVVITGITPINDTTMNVDYYRQNGDTYQQQVIMDPNIMQEQPIRSYIETLIPFIDKIDKQDSFDEAAKWSQEVLDTIAEDSSKIFRQQRVGKTDVQKGTISKEEEGLIIIDIDTNPSNPNDPNSEPIPNRVVAEVADADGNISKITYQFKSNVLDIMSLEDWLEYYQAKVDQVAFNQHNYKKALELSKPIFREMSKDLKRVTINLDRGNKIVYESAVDEPIKIGDFTLFPPLPVIVPSKETKVEEDGTQLCDTPLAIDYFKSLILPNFQSVKEEEEQPRKMTKEEFHKEFGEGANVDVINAGREPQDRIEITESSAYIDPTEIMWYAEQYLNGKIGKCSLVRLDDGQYQIQLNNNEDKWLDLHSQITESSTEEYWNGTEITRDGFDSLLKFNFGRDSNGNNYIITRDNNEVKRLNASTDEEAVKLYNQWKDAPRNGFGDYTLTEAILETDCAKCGAKNIKGEYHLINKEGKDIAICNDCARKYSLHQLEITEDNDKHSLISRIVAKYPDISQEDEDYLSELPLDGLINEIYNRGWEDVLESAEDRYQLRENGEKAQPYGVYDTKLKKFIQKGNKKVMTAAVNDLNKVKEDTWYEDLPDEYSRAAANAVISYIERRGGTQAVSKADVIDIIDHVTNDLIPVDQKGYDKLYDYIMTVYLKSANK